MNRRRVEIGTANAAARRWLDGAAKRNRIG